MIKIIKFELLKFIKSKKNIAILSIYLILILLSTFLLKNLENNYIKGLKNNYEFEKNLITSNLNDLLIRKNKIENDNTLKKEMDKKMLFLSNTAMAVNNITMNIKDANIRLRYTNDLLKILSKDYNLVQEFSIFKALSKKEINEKIKINSYIIENNIKAMSSPYEPSFSNFLYLLIRYPYIFIILLLPVLLFFNLSADEFNYGTYKIILSRPISRSKIIIAKIFLGMMLFLSSLIILLCFSYLSFKINGVDGNFSYPAIYSSGRIHPLNELLLNTLIMYIISGMFFIALSSLLGILLKEGSNVLIIFTLLFILAYTLFDNFNLSEKELMYSPFLIFKINNYLNSFMLNFKIIFVQMVYVILIIIFNVFGIKKFES